MTTDSPDDPPPWVAGPPEGYAPYEGTRPLPPDQQAETNARGRQAVLDKLAEAGIRKTDGKWLPRDTTTEGA